MNNQVSTDLLESRVCRLVDDRLFRAFWDGAAHFGTRDLVLFFDESAEVDPVDILPRDRVACDPKIPGRIQERLRKPAVYAATKLTTSDTAFWLVVFFNDGESAIFAINAKPIAPGGHA